MVLFKLGKITFELKEQFEFSFLDEFGEPFAVFDRQDSGNLCFGVEKDGRKLFLKLAGAKTLTAAVSCKQAIDCLRASSQIYEELLHKNLVNLLSHRPIPGGYLLVFEWFDGVCMGKQYGKFGDFRKISTEKKLRIYRDILDFHSFANKKGYIAVDFYDGCLMYNADTEKTILCDIDLYQKKPVINTMGRMYGSTRFMSPEEFILGEEIDERSNVFCMGATAFNLFGGGADRSYERWTASKDLYNVAMKAISPNKADRYASIDEYIISWEKALAASR